MRPTNALLASTEQPSSIKHEYRDQLEAVISELFILEQESTAWTYHSIKQNVVISQLRSDAYQALSPTHQSQIYEHQSVYKQCGVDGIGTSKPSQRLRGQGIVHSSPELTFNCISDLDMYQMWDGFSAENKILSEYYAPDQTLVRILHIRFNAIFPFANRDVCVCTCKRFIRDVSIYTNGSTQNRGMEGSGTARGSPAYVLAAFSLNHPGCPPIPGYVRANLDASGFIIRPHPYSPCSEVTYILQFDAKGWLPIALQSLISEDQPLRIAKIRSIAESYATKAASNTIAALGMHNHVNSTDPTHKVSVKEDTPDTKTATFSPIDRNETSQSSIVEPSFAWLHQCGSQREEEEFIHRECLKMENGPSLTSNNSDWAKYRSSSSNSLNSQGSSNNTRRSSSTYLSPRKGSQIIRSGSHSPDEDFGTYYTASSGGGEQDQNQLLYQQNGTIDSGSHHGNTRHASLTLPQSQSPQLASSASQPNLASDIPQNRSSSISLAPSSNIRHRRRTSSISNGEAEQSFRPSMPRRLSSSSFHSSSSDPQNQTQLKFSCRQITEDAADVPRISHHQDEEVPSSSASARASTSPSEIINTMEQDVQLIKHYQESTFQKLRTVEDNLRSRTIEMNRILENFELFSAFVIRCSEKLKSYASAHKGMEQHRMRLETRWQAKISALSTQLDVAERGYWTSRRKRQAVATRWTLTILFLFSWPVVATRLWSILSTKEWRSRISAVLYKIWLSILKRLT